MAAALLQPQRLYDAPAKDIILCITYCSGRAKALGMGVQKVMAQ
jgi:hypothetical protein